ncbi:hypothetical protein QZH41_015149, partial [Actinostola sp. cb2023]
FDNFASDLLLDRKTMGILNDDDKKAFFTVLEQFQASKLTNKRGSGFKMKMLDSAQLFFVSSSSVFTDPQQALVKTFVAQRCLAKKKAGIEQSDAVREELDVKNLNTSKEGVSFIECSDESKSKAKNKYYLTFGLRNDPLPQEAVAFVFDGQNILELKFQKTGEISLQISYKMDDVSKVSKNLELQKAVGAPIIIEVSQPKRNQVVGVLDVKADGSLYPVFFSESTFIIGHQLKYDDLVSNMRDDASDILNDIILKLDKGNLWKAVASKLGITEQKYCVFARDPNLNPTQTLFNVLGAYSPLLEVRDLKSNLKTLGEKDLLGKLDTIPDESLVNSLPSKPNLMCDEIERFLNNPSSNMLYKLAGKFKDQGKIPEDCDIRIFHQQEIEESPTQMLMDKVISSHKERYTAQDLVDRLYSINRKDCVEIVRTYLLQQLS